LLASSARRILSASADPGFVPQIEGDLFLAVNGRNLGSVAPPLRDEDVTELAGVTTESDRPPRGSGPVCGFPGSVDRRS